jgi:hypothetical protein
MEMLAGWIASTPEMELKVLFGRHVWECAQHADALGKRAFELRVSLHFTLEPLGEYREFLQSANEISDSRTRLNRFYDVILPGLLTKYQDYLAWTDPLMDEPSVRIVQGIIDSIHRMHTECAELRAEHPVFAVPVNKDSISDVFDVFVEHQGPSLSTESIIA